MIIVMMSNENSKKWLAQLKPEHIGYSKDADYIIRGWELNLVPVRQMLGNEVIIYSDLQQALCLRFWTRHHDTTIATVMEHALFHLERIMFLRPITVSPDIIFEKIVVLFS